MSNATSFIHFGKWLKSQIEMRGVSKQAFADAHGLKLSTVVHWTLEEAPSLHGRNVAKLAKALGMTRESLESRLAEARQTHETAA